MRSPPTAGSWIGAICCRHDFVLGTHKSTCVWSARNGQLAAINFASDFQLGAIAQLEERRLAADEVVGSSPPSSTPDSADGDFVEVGAHEFRNRFGWYMERAAAGEEFLVTRRGRPTVRLIAAACQTEPVGD